MIGESLEQHCEYEFNKNRMATASKWAEFGEDNDARTGKGDYIYREVDENGKFPSCLRWKMKDETALRRKTAFFKELDKDRREKGCSMPF